MEDSGGHLQPSHRPGPVPAGSLLSNCEPQRTEARPCPGTVAKLCLGLADVTGASLPWSRHLEMQSAHGWVWTPQCTWSPLTCQDVTTPQKPLLWPGSGIAAFQEENTFTGDTPCGRAFLSHLPSPSSRVCRVDELRPVIPGMARQRGYR